MPKIGRRRFIAGLAGTSAVNLSDSAAGGNLAPLALPAVTGSGASLDLRNRDLSGADLQGRNLVGIDLRDVRLWGTQFQRADLRGADLRGADLWRCCLAGALLVGADLRKAYLFDTRLSWADLSDAQLDDAVLDGANFCGARARRIDFRRTRLTDPDEGYRLSGTMYSPTDLSGSIFAGMDLSRSALTFVDFSGATLVGVKFGDASGREKVRRLDGVNFANADVAGADLRNVAWEHPVSFARANLTDARLSCGAVNETLRETTAYVLDDLSGPNRFHATLCRTQIGSVLHG